MCRFTAAVAPSGTVTSYWNTGVPAGGGGDAAPKVLIPLQPLAITAKDFTQLTHGSVPPPGVSPFCSPAMRAHELLPTHSAATFARVPLAAHLAPFLNPMPAPANHESVSHTAL